MNTSTTPSNYFYAGDRTYFFNIRQTKKGASYLNINISKKDKTGKFINKGITVFENEMKDFSMALMRSVINFKKTGKEAQVKEAQKTFPNAFKVWTKEAEETLEVEFADEKNLTELSEILGRKESAIQARIVKLRLEEKYIL